MVGKRIVGLDPGSHHLGLACIEIKGKSITLIHAETLSPPGAEAFFDRLHWISNSLRRKVEELHPAEVALEDTFFSNNAQSAFRLGMARGVAFASCLAPGIRIFEYAPSRIKLVVTGYGRADKTQVKKMVGLILGKPIDLGFDATDAVAVALCHAFTLRLEPGNT